MDLSIIVPVYNTERYLDRCLKSLLNIKDLDIEIILVDDGSTDASAKKCDYYSGNFSSVVSLHKENEGLGLTRNYGLEFAKGEYVFFVDSDDFIQFNQVNSLIEKAKKENLDVCCFGRSFYSKGVVTKGDERFPKQPLDYKELSIRCFGEPLKSDEYQIGPAWKAIYKREFLRNHKLKFESERVVLSEDYAFSAKLFLEKPNVGFYEEDVYVYCDNAGSLTNSYNKERAIRAVRLYEYMDNLIVLNKLDYEAKQRAYNNFIINMLVVFKHIVLYENMSKKEKKIEILRTIENEEIRNIVCKKYQLDTFQLQLLQRLIINKRVEVIYLLMRLRYRRKNVKDMYHCTV